VVFIRCIYTSRIWYTLDVGFNVYRGGFSVDLNSSRSYSLENLSQTQLLRTQSLLLAVSATSKTVMSWSILWLANTVDNNYINDHMYIVMLLACTLFRNCLF
jgi:hypothetical protein